MDELPILLLAAGRSKRMGQPKQLLRWGNTTLIEHQIQVLRKTGHPVVVVLGHGSALLIPLAEQAGAEIVVNRDWENGMGSSIAAGVGYLMGKGSTAKGVLITLVDQPLVPGEHYSAMLSAFRPGNGMIIGSRFKNGIAGVPALFDAVYFRELVALQGEGGAKKIIRAHREQLVHAECDELGEDLDTPEEYRRLHARYMEGRMGDA